MEFVLYAFGALEMNGFLLVGQILRNFCEDTDLQME